MFYRLINTLLNNLKDLFVPLIALYIERVVETLTLFGIHSSGDTKKRLRGEVDITSEEGHNYYELLLLTVENVKLNFTNDNQAFIQNDTFEKLSEPLANLATLPTLGAKYLTFIEDSLKPTIYEAVDRINNDDMWKKINNELLMQTRNPSPILRLGTFKIVENLFNKMGERYLVLLNDTLPFLSEGMEDESPDVELTTRSIVQRIEQMTGDSIHEYLK